MYKILEGKFAKWNPVTGCLNYCDYCYARKFAARFDGCWNQSKGINVFKEIGVLRDLGTPQRFETKKGNIIKAPFPYGFDPTFHRSRLAEPTGKKQPQNIFVCSMADLFGDWVPDEWIKMVFEACMKAPQHRYLFLTKNPDRYDDFFRCWEAPENFYFGTTIVNDKQDYYYSNMNNTFLSIEPIQDDFSEQWEIKSVNWVIIGAETGNRKNKIIPERKWIENIVRYCHAANVPVFVKSSLQEIWGEPLIQEYP